MVKVDNGETIHTLAGRFIKVNKNRNIIAVIAIILTSVLFTSVFTASFSIIKSNMESEMRIAMDKSHVSVENLTKEQYEKISKDHEIVKLGLSIFLTLAENQELQNIQTEIRYADKNAASSYQCEPTTGRLPEDVNELATSTRVLDALGIAHKLGEKVSLTYTLDHQTITKKFKLCGYWKGDSATMAQLVWIAKAYCDSAAEKATEESIGRGIYEGDYNASIWFSNVFHLEQKAEDLARRNHLNKSNAKVSANPAYKIFDEDAFPFGTVAMILVMVVLSGYLIIYNIFHISVNLDIRTYGLLKNIGTTGKQLKKIVRMQAFNLSAIGIPLGLIVGFLVGKAMTPFLLADLTESGKNIQTSVSASPYIFIAASLFSLITVYIGCLKPCHIVERISPVEAVRMTDIKIYKRKEKKTGNISAFSMAFSNIERTWNKGLSVVISLALSLTVLNMAYVIVNGFDFNSYTSTLINADFEINRFTTTLKSYDNLNCITPEFRMLLDQNKDISSVGYIYFSRSAHKLDDNAYHNLQNTLEKIGMDVFNKQQKEEIQENLMKHEVTSHVMGINEAAFNKLVFQRTDCTWDEFRSGKYMITGFLDVGKYYSTGDIVNVKFDDHNSKEYKVIALANLPYTLDFHYYDGAITQTFLLPEEEYQKESGNQNAMVAAVDTKKGKMFSVSKWLKTYMDQNDGDYIVNSRYQIQKEFSSFVNKYFIIGGMLTAILFVIGILNFFNTSATSILSRKKELSLLEVIGMTKKQILKMLFFEGLFYLLLAFLLASTIGTVIARELINMSVGMIFFFHCKMSIILSLIAIPVLVFIIFIIPIYNYRKMCGQTVIERIQSEE